MRCTEAKYLAVNHFVLPNQALAHNLLWSRASVRHTVRCVLSFCAQSAMCYVWAGVSIDAFAHRCSLLRGSLFRHPSSLEGKLVALDFA